MCREFASKGHEVILTGVLTGTIDEIGSFEIGVKPIFTRWPNRFFEMRRNMRLAKNLLVSEAPDLVFTRTPVFALLAANSGFRTVVELHGLPRKDSENSAALSKLLDHPNLARIVTISNGLYQDLNDSYGTAHADVDTIIAHDGAVAGRCPSEAPNQKPLKVGYFGHLYDGKGMEILAKLAPAVPNMQFVVYGGHNDDVKRWRKITSGVNNIKLCGYIEHKHVRTQSEQCDILIAPYSSKVKDISGNDIGGWMSPLKLFEYMAAGRPIVATDISISREIFSNDNPQALLCRYGVIQDWINALNILESDDSLRTHLGRAARSHLLLNYTWEKRTDTILAGLTT